MRIFGIKLIVLSPQLFYTAKIDVCAGIFLILIFNLPEFGLILHETS